MELNFLKQIGTVQYADWNGKKCFTDFDFFFLALILKKEKEKKKSHGNFSAVLKLEQKLTNISRRLF